MTVLCFGTTMGETMRGSLRERLRGWSVICLVNSKTKMKEATNVAPAGGKMRTVSEEAPKKIKRME